MAKQSRNYEILHAQVGPYVKGEVVSHEELAARGADFRHLLAVKHQTAGPAVKVTDKAVSPRSELPPPLIVQQPEFMQTDEETEPLQIEDPDNPGSDPAAPPAGNGGGNGGGPTPEPVK